jgi:hypothetical protein
VQDDRPPCAFVVVDGVAGHLVVRVTVSRVVAVEEVTG